jgi:hypothetical protein
MIVIDSVPPNGTAKDVRAMTEAMLLGKNLMPWRELGIKRIPVPAPVRAIMPYMVALWPWYRAHVRIVMPVASMIEPRKIGVNVWRG